MALHTWASKGLLSSSHSNAHWWQRRTLTSGPGGMLTRIARASGSKSKENSGPGEKGILVALSLGFSKDTTVWLDPSLVTPHGYLYPFVSSVSEGLSLSLDPKVGFFWSVAPCGRCVGRGWRCDGPSQTSNGYSAVSSVSREQGRTEVKNHDPWLLFLPLEPGAHRQIDQPLGLSFPNCIMGRIVYFIFIPPISLMWLENKMRGQKGKGCEA